MNSPARAKPSITQIRRGRLPTTAAATPRGRPRKIERPQRFPQRDHPIKHHVAGPGANPWSRTEVSPGARAHNNTAHTNRAHAPPTCPGAVAPSNRGA